MSADARRLTFELLLSPFQRRAVALGLFALPAVLIGAVLCSYVSGALAQRTRIVAIAREESVYLQLMGDLPARRSEIVRLRVSEDSAMLFPKLPAAAAARKIESAISSALTGSGASPKENSIEVRGSRFAPVTQFVDHAAMTCDIATLVRVLRAIALTRPALFFDRVAISRVVPRAGTGALLTGPQLLNVDLTLSAYERQ